MEPGVWAARHEAGYIDDIALTREDRHQLGRLGEPERSRMLFRRALRELAADPGRYPRLCLRRLGYFILFDETNPKSRSMLYRVPHVGLTLFAAAGLWLAGPILRRSLLPTIAVAAVIAVFHAMTIVSARFHIPLEPLLATWGAVGCTSWLARRATVRRAGQASSASGPHHVKCVGVEDRLLGADLGRRHRIELAL